MNRFRWRFFLGAVAGAAILLLGVAVINNNFPRAALPRADFEKRLDSSFQRARTWILLEDYEPLPVLERRGNELVNNPSLLHMVQDSGRLAHDKPIQSIIRLFFQHRVDTASWGRILDESVVYQPLSPPRYAELHDYQHWFLHAMAPDQVALTEQERQDLESWDGMKRGRLTHQVMALLYDRQLNGATPDRDRQIRHLCERIAVEQKWDFRVTDQYLQRVALLFWAGHSDLVHPRWVERVLDSQQDDGGWTYTWHGWNGQVFRFQFPESNSDVHATVQGMWIVAQVRYRHPDWIARNYH